jgi:glycosyltransferase involved in cell wall biosynthesis
MKVYVVKDGIHSLSNGEVSHYTADYHRFAKRYLAGFKRVVIVGRLFEREDEGARPVTGPGVDFLAVPGFQGPHQFLGVAVDVILFVLRAARPGAAYILRMPATLPLLFGFVLYLRRIPYAVELVGDPREAYDQKVLRKRFSVFWQRLFVWATGFLCRKAVANSYVTRRALQLSYPPGSESSSFSFTSLELRDEMIAVAPRADFTAGRALRLVSVGMMHNAVKGFDLLLEAVRRCRLGGVDVSLAIVGDGALRPEYEAQCEQAGISGFVKFLGRLDDFNAISLVLDDSDLFVLASRQEGLPRVMIEEMARSLPCISSRVGGTDELLPEDCLFNSDDIDGLVRLISNRAKDHRSLIEESERNLRAIQSYKHDAVQIERNKFYRATMLDSA